jgi:hypothetical protein
MIGPDGRPLGKVTSTLHLLARGGALFWQELCRCPRIINLDAYLSASSSMSGMESRPVGDPHCRRVSFPNRFELLTDRNPSSSRALPKRGEVSPGLPPLKAPKPVGDPRHRRVFWLAASSALRSHALMTFAGTAAADTNAVALVFVSSHQASCLGPSWDLSVLCPIGVLKA